MNRLNLLFLLDAAGIPIYRESYKIYLATGTDSPPTAPFLVSVVRQMGF